MLLTKTKEINMTYKQTLDFEQLKNIPMYSKIIRNLENKIGRKPLPKPIQELLVFSEKNTHVKDNQAKQLIGCLNYDIKKPINSAPYDESVTGEYVEGDSVQETFECSEFLTRRLAGSDVDLSEILSRLDELEGNAPRLCGSALYFPATHRCCSGRDVKPKGHSCPLSCSYSRCGCRERFCTGGE